MFRQQELLQEEGRGGRGGVGETQRISLLLSMPACAEMNAAMHDFTQINYETSEQHQEMSTARLKRDEKDSKAVLRYLQDRNPFTDDASLQNIATGVAAQASANVEHAEEIAKSILSSMENETAVEYTFKKKDRVNLLNQIQLLQSTASLFQLIHSFYFSDWLQLQEIFMITQQRSSSMSCAIFLQHYLNHHP